MTHRTQLWIGGAWRPAADGRTLVDRNPEDDAPYAEAARAGAADVDAAVDAAQHAFSTYRRTLASEREAWLLKAAQLLEQRADAFADVLIDEIGDRLVEAPAVRAVNFTGSTRVGRHLSGLCGRHPKRALLAQVFIGFEAGAVGKAITLGEKLIAEWAGQGIGVVQASPALLRSARATYSDAGFAILRKRIATALA